MLGDLRNICCNNKDKEPTFDQVEDLLNGTDKVLKTIVEGFIHRGIMQYLKLEINKVIDDYFLEDPTGRARSENTFSESLVLKIFNTIKEVSANVSICDEIHWKLIKQRGENEKEFGDLCFLFDFINPNGNRRTGIGFLEAKIFKALRKSTFQGKELEQFNRFNEKGRIKYLFYLPTRLEGYFNFTSCLYLNSPTVRSCDLANGVCLGSQISERFMEGFDLIDLDPTGPSGPLNSDEFNNKIKECVNSLSDSAYLFVRNVDSRFDGFLDLISDDPYFIDMEPPEKMLFTF